MKNPLEKLLSWLPSRGDTTDLRDIPAGASDGVDAIVTWVDGSDWMHSFRRRLALRAMSVPPHKIGKAARRFTDNNEIRFCLRSLHNYAPWLRTIWLVTDRQIPKWLDVREARKAGIRIVDHKHIFRQYEKSLPTFNSLSIETMMWRIEGLSERFVYFNDDMFLTNPTDESTFFTDNKPIIRGHVVDVSRRKKQPNLYTKGILNSEDMLGVSREQHFSSGHVIYPMLRSALEELFERFKPEFIANASHPFRDIRQFQLIALHNAYVMSTGRGVAHPGDDMLHFHLNFCTEATASEIVERLDGLSSPGIVAGCINYTEMVVPKVEDLFARWSRIAGPPAPFERN